MAGDFDGGRRSDGGAQLESAAESDRRTTPRTVWLLCTTQPGDVLPTIRSRCRHLSLVTPSVEEVAQLLIEREDRSRNCSPGGRSVPIPYWGGEIFSSRSGGTGPPPQDLTCCHYYLQCGRGRDAGATTGGGGENRC